MTAAKNKAATVVPLTNRRCPICGKPVVAAFRPFCSKRCADVDLGRWLNEDYRVPTDEAPDEMPSDAVADAIADADADEED